MATATREQLETDGASIIIDAYEGGSCGLASWAVDNGTYKWGSENGDYELGEHTRYASVTLHDCEDCELLDLDDPDYGDYDKGYNGWAGFVKYGKPLYIDSKIVADFIVKVGTGDFSQDHVPDYGRLGTRTLNALRGMYFGDEDAFDNWDCVDADAVIQFILFGEVVYG